MILEKYEKLKEKLKKAEYKRGLQDQIYVEHFEEVFASVPKELKHKNGRPTVLEYKGNFYILDHTRLKK